MRFKFKKYMNIERLVQNWSENYQTMEVILDVKGVVIHPFGLKLGQNEVQGPNIIFYWLVFPKNRQKRFTGSIRTGWGLKLVCIYIYIYIYIYSCFFSFILHASNWPALLNISFDTFSENWFLSGHWFRKILLWKNIIM